MRMPRYHRSAFTLIELLIAIALGLVIVYTAFAGFRAASQSVTIANRLSVENSLLRAAYLAAHEELDFWQMYDDPEDTARQKLRGLAGSEGLPFTPFRAVPAFAASSGRDRELRRGWDADERSFAAHDPRTWFRGNMAEKTDTALIFGRYGTLANLKRNGIIFTDFTETTTTPLSNAATPAVSMTTTASYSGAAAKHNWYYNQVQDLVTSLGNYGLCEYLPANAIYAVYGDAGDGTDSNAGGIPNFYIRPDNGRFCNGDGSQKTSRSKYRQTYMTSYMLSNPNRAIGAGDLNGEMRRYWHVGFSNGEMDQFAERTLVPIGLLDGPDADLVAGDGEKPAVWPEVTVGVSRFIKNVRHVNVAKVRWTSPLTGELVELSFSGFGTTLRGARQQRRPDGGWAEWDNGPGAHTGPQYKTLDSY